MSLLLGVNTLTDKHRIKMVEWNMTYNKSFWIISPLITTFDMSKVLVLFLQVWHPLWLILRFHVWPKQVLVGPPIPKKRWHIRKNDEFEVISLFSMIFLGTSESQKVPWNYCKHHFPKLKCPWVALVANRCCWAPFCQFESTKNVMLYQFSTKFAID